MGLLKQWRQQNQTWKSFTNKYVQLKRKIRIARLPSQQYQQYQSMCDSYQSALLSASIDGVPQFIERPINICTKRGVVKKSYQLRATH